MKMTKLKLIKKQELKYLLPQDFKKKSDLMCKCLNMESFSVFLLEWIYFSAYQHVSVCLWTG